MASLAALPSRAPIGLFAVWALLCAACADDMVDPATCGQQARCGEGPLYAVTELTFAMADENGRLEGFDLDGVVSDSAEGQGCFVPDRVAPDGRQGIDNELPSLLALGGPAVSSVLPDAIRSAIADGALVMLLELVDSPDGDRDALVVRRGLGPPLLGTDGLYLPFQTFELEAKPLMGHAPRAATGAGWATTTPFDLDFRFTFLGTPIRLPFRASRVRAAREADGSLSGVLGAHVLVEDALALASFLEGDDTGVADVLRTVLPGLADIRSRGDECDAFSAAVLFRAVPAFVFPNVRQGPLTGSDLFVRATCHGCHPVTGLFSNATPASGPSLDGLGTRAGRIVEGLSAEAYVRQSILEPDAHVVAGYEDRRMPATLGQFFEPGELDTLVAWLLSL